MGFTGFEVPNLEAVRFDVKQANVDIAIRKEFTTPTLLTAEGGGFENNFRGGKLTIRQPNRHSEPPGALLMLPSGYRIDTAVVNNRQGKVEVGPLLAYSLQIVTAGAEVAIRASTLDSLELESGGNTLLEGVVVRGESSARPNCKLTMKDRRALTLTGCTARGWNITAWGSTITAHNVRGPIGSTGHKKLTQTGTRH